MVALRWQVMDPEFRKKFQNVNRWFSTMVNQPHFKAVTGEVKLATKMAQFDGKFGEVALPVKQSLDSSDMIFC